MKLMLQRLLPALRVCRTGLLILLITLCLLEAVLQVAALVVDKHSKVAQWMHPGAIRIVTLGDSNTYGLYLQADQAYPALFETQWNKLHADRPVEVINLGYPGTNSSRVLKSLPDVLDTFSPDIITVMVGVNDFWMAPVETDAAATAGLNIYGWLRDHSRVFKLVYLLKRQGYNAAELKVDADYRQASYDASLQPLWKEAIAGKTPMPLPDKPQAIHYGDKVFDIGFVFDASHKENLPENMQKNFSAIAALAEQHHARLVFITYAYYEFPQKAANQQMKVTCKKFKLPLVNAAHDLRESCDEGVAACNALFFPDYHPSAAGHRKLADILVRDLDPIILSL